MPQSKARKGKVHKKKRQIQGGGYRPPIVTPPEIKELSPKTKEPPPKKESKAEDASYTLSELRKIGIIAGTLIFALIVTSLVL
jgi:hypothetical protein